MRLLLDTHSFLRFHTNDPLLSTTALALIEGTPILGADAAFDAYPITRIW